MVDRWGYVLMESDRQKEVTIGDFSRSGYSTRGSHLKLLQTRVNLLPSLTEIYINMFDLYCSP